MNTAAQIAYPEMRQEAPAVEELNVPPVNVGVRPRPGQRRRVGWWLDALFVVLIVLASIPIRLLPTSGDLWQDEADYAVAATHGFHANAWTMTPSLVRYRHFHPPLVTETLALVEQFDKSELALRLPFVLLGALSIGLVYLIGLSVMGGRRELAFVCAAIALVTPAHIRASSHALPWSFITFEILALLYVLCLYAETRIPALLVAGWVVLGLTFATSEMVFPMLAACLVSLPMLFVGVLRFGRRATKRDRDHRLLVLIAFAAGIALFLAIVAALWPAGLSGGAWTCLHHYMLVSKATDIQVLIGHEFFSPAPKSAYLYWYWNDFRPYGWCYALGFAGVALLLVSRTMSRQAGILTAFTVVLTASAHLSHIIGPEYLVHCLPLYTLMCGIFCYVVGCVAYNLYGILFGSEALRDGFVRLVASVVSRLIGFGVAALLLFQVASWEGALKLPGMDGRSEISRWPAAARFLAASWQPGKSIMVGPQTAGVVLWYMRDIAHIPVMEDQVQPMPVSAPQPWMLHKLAYGVYPYVVVSSTFKDRPHFDPRFQRLFNDWPIVFESAEMHTGRSRLVIFQVPPGGGRFMPSPLPPVPPPGAPAVDPSTYMK
jgi:hypothetical protein